MRFIHHLLNYSSYSWCLQFFTINSSMYFKMEKLMKCFLLYYQKVDGFDVKSIIQSSKTHFETWAIRVSTIEILQNYVLGCNLCSSLQSVIKNSYYHNLLKKQTTNLINLKKTIDRAKRENFVCLSHDYGHPMSWILESTYSIWDKGKNVRIFLFPYRFKMCPCRVVCLFHSYGQMPSLPIQIKFWFFRYLHKKFIGTLLN